MTLFSLILALILEQFRPLNAARYLRPVLSALGHFFEDRFNDGEARHGTVAWCLMVVPPVVAAAVAHFLLHLAHPLLAVLFNVGVLYYTMGFRHVSHFFTGIHAALRVQDLQRARALLSEWRGHRHDQSGTEEIARLAIEEGILGSHRQVFAIIFWFVVLPGPSGAILYRMAHFYAKEWERFDTPETGHFGHFAKRAFAAIEWLPARITAMAFSIVGDFEDAAYCWRTQASQWFDKAEGILLAAGAGALGVRLGLPIIESGELIERPELGTGDEVEVEHLQSFVGLVRRTLVLNVLVLAMLGLSRIAS